jgi:hypothetical protein
VLILTSIPHPPYVFHALILIARYRIHNADVLFREDASVDQLIDVIEGAHSASPAAPRFFPPLTFLSPN